MCGRYSLTTSADIVDTMQLALPAELAGPRFNIAPTQTAPVVVMRDGVRAITAMRWGLVAPWRGHGGKRGPLLINAQLESLGGRGLPPTGSAAEWRSGSNDTKPIFRDAFRKRRCLVLADGFFEWQVADGKKQPIWFHRDDRRVFAFAGIWTQSRDDDQPTYAILTRTPNALVAPIHDRMPIVLAPSAYTAWLDPGVSVELARELCAPVPVEGWRADAVSSRVNSAANDDAACIAAADRTPPAQLRLL